MDIMKKHVGQIILSIVIAIIGVICSVLPYFAVANIVTEISKGSTGLAIFGRQIMIILLGLVGSVGFHTLSTLISHNLAFCVIEDSRKKLARKFSKLPMGTIEKRGSGEWTQFMVETLNKMEQPIAHVIPEVIANFIIPIVLLIIIFILDWRIGIANLVTLPLGFLFSILMMGGYEEKSKRYQEASKNMNSTAVEYIRGINIIKAFNKSASSYGKFVNAVELNKNSMLDWYLSICFYMTATMEVLPSTLIFVLPTSLYVFMKGTIDVGTLIMCVLLSYASYKPLVKAMSHLDTMANVKVVIDEIKNVMNLSELKRGNSSQEINSYDVSFDRVTFGYDKNKKVFQELSFTAKEGELTAIVGYSGGGKSTLAKLIAGFWNIDSGKISIGNVDLNDISLEKNMDLVTYVSQENYLFQKSIADNMRMAKPDASIEEIQNACKKASCHDFIMSLPYAYETVIGESGNSLSGGERQRITIARALLKDSPIVLLDEATAYSDPDNEAEIQKSLDALVKDKTVIMIAHRLSTIIHANKIIVINSGKIEAEGTHQELLQGSSTYSRMWNAHNGVNLNEGVR